MANIQQILNEEIRRLARKEVIVLGKQLVELRKLVAAQNRRIKELEKNLTAPKAAAEAPKAAENKPETIDPTLSTPLMLEIS